MAGSCPGYSRPHAYTVFRSQCALLIIITILFAMFPFCLLKFGNCCQSFRFVFLKSGNCVSNSLASMMSDNLRSFFLGRKVLNCFLGRAGHFQYQVLTKTIWASKIILIGNYIQDQAQLLCSICSEIIEQDKQSSAIRCDLRRNGLIGDSLTVHFTSSNA